MAKELKAAGCDVTEHVGKYDKPGLSCFGVVGVMKNGPGPTVLVRSDLDALPVHEETGLPYASTVTTKNNEGKEVPVMHACGHDIHTTVQLGVATVLASMKADLPGTVNDWVGLQGVLEFGLWYFVVLAAFEGLIVLGRRQFAASSGRSEDANAGPVSK